MITFCRRPDTGPGPKICATKPRPKHVQTSTLRVNQQVDVTSI